MFSWLFLEAPRNLGILALVLVGILAAVSFALRGVRDRVAGAQVAHCPRCGGTGRVEGGAGGDWPCLEEVHRAGRRS